jgi:restriction system protein
MTCDYVNLMKPWYGEIEVDQPLVEVSDAARASAPDHASHSCRISGLYREMFVALQEDLLGYVHAQPAGFFEQLVIDVTLSLGYAGRRRDWARKIGGSGDGGIDAVIALDELGLDAIYLQAKRLKPGSCVSAAQVRDFIGGLDTHHANKGVFVTTGEFTSAARAAAQNVSKRVVLINGKALTDLMIRHCIGVRLTETFQFKEIDLSYFQGRATAGSNASASIQPRR